MYVVGHSAGRFDHQDGLGKDSHGSARSGSRHPADLLRRRPDVRVAERKAAAQSAAIGIAESAFYPHLFLNGTIGYSAAELRHFFLYTAFTGTIGPSFRWDILNYGRLLNEVRREDAIFKQLVVAYQNTVLSANAEVESAMVLFLRTQEQRRKLRESVAATQWRCAY